MSLLARLLAGRLSIQAVAPTLSLQAAADNTTLRLFKLGLPSTLSFASILSELGMPTSGVDSSSFVTVANTSLKYVPLVNGEAGEQADPSQAPACVRVVLGDAIGLKPRRIASMPPRLKDSARTHGTPLRTPFSQSSLIQQAPGMEQGQPCLPLSRYPPWASLPHKLLW